MFESVYKVGERVVQYNGRVLTIFGVNGLELYTVKDDYGKVWFVGINTIDHEATNNFNQFVKDENKNTNIKENKIMKPASLRSGKEVVLKNGRVVVVERIVPHDSEFIVVEKGFFTKKVTIKSSEVDFAETRKLQNKIEIEEFTLDDMESGYVCYLDSSWIICEWSSLFGGLMAHYDKNNVRMYELTKDFKVVGTNLSVLQITNRDGETLWQRTEKSAQQIEIERIESTIRDCADRLSKLKGEM